MDLDSSAQEMLYFNGINGETGDYEMPPMTGEQLFKFISGSEKVENLSELRYFADQGQARHFAVAEDIDPRKLDEAGWGVIFAHDADPAVKEALAPLLAWRQECAGERYRCYEGENGFLRGLDNKRKFLGRNGAGPGPVDPSKVPYYLLIVGGPAEIPYRFQSQMDVQYAVGRLHFDDVEAYAQYAQNVVAAEKNGRSVKREMAFFSPTNADDRATELSATQLVAPLLAELEVDRPEWQYMHYGAEAATKAQLGRLLGGDQTPAVLFSASHGVQFPPGNARQLAHQGALICQEWPGPQAWRRQGPLEPDHYFAAEDVAAGADLGGLIAFFFACFSAGTPQFDEFSRQAFKDREAIAETPFLSQLPLRLLSQAGGGALAAVGHVDRAWGYSFAWPGAGSQTTVFTSTLKRLLDGHPVGSAMEYFNQRYAEISTELSDELEEIEYGKKADPYEMAGLWTANNDARGYAIIGDPAVRLPNASSP